MKQLIKRLLPKAILTLNNKAQIMLLRHHFARLTLRQAFSEIYDRGLWGSDGGGNYYSGSGSRGSAAEKYVSFVQDFIVMHQIKSVVDLGCGDFYIGKQIAPLTASYIGIDIVPALIDRLTTTYASEHISFKCLDITTDALPKADLCLVRQVFQHLSNCQIKNALSKLQTFPFVLITEHYPSKLVNSVSNKDKPHGPDTRLIENSGIILDQPPFNVNAKEVLIVEADHYLVAPGETIRTFLLKTVK